MQLRRGLFRLYLVVSIGWVGWFGYVIYDSSRLVSVASDYIQTFNNERRMGLQSPYDIVDLVAWQSREHARQTTAEKAILLFPILAPVLYFLCGWIIRGFGRDDARRQNAPESKLKEVMDDASSKPASTLLLILSLFAAPMFWLVDAGAMANFWVARLRKDR